LNELLQVTPRPIPPSTRKIAAKGATVIVAAQMLRLGVNFIAGIALARLLKPADFGLLAAVWTYLTFASVIQDLGMNLATIQRPKISHRQMSALFWISTGFSVALAVVVIISAPVVGWFFRDSRVISLTMASSVLIVLGGVQSQNQALMNREMRFKSLALIDVLTATISAGIGIAVAWITLSYWALVAASIGGGLTSVIATWALSRWRPGRPSFEGQFREIVGLGVGVTGAKIVNYFARNADNLLIGRYYGPEQLGLYDRAYRLFLLPLQQLHWPIGRVMLPLLSGLQSDPERYRKVFIECISLLMTATQPALIFAIVFAEDVFLILLGPQWVPAAPIFRWLGLVGLHQVMAVDWLFESQGRAADLFKINLFSAVVQTSAFIVGLPWGPLGVAMAYAITNYVVIVPVSWWSTGRRGPITTKKLYSIAIPHFIAASVCALVLLVIAKLLPPSGIFMCGILGALSYGIYLLVIIIFPSKRDILAINLRFLIASLRRT
jgi:polysaccharide transporter, PST family